LLPEGGREPLRDQTTHDIDRAAAANGTISLIGLLG
jgi:hypothetical protein